MPTAGGLSRRDACYLAQSREIHPQFRLKYVCTGHGHICICCRYVRDDTGEALSRRFRHGLAEGGLADLPQAIREDAIIVSIPRDGAVFIGRDRVEPERIAAAIHKDVECGSETKVYIRPDARTLYRNVKQVLDAVHEAGLVNVSFMVS